MAGKYELKSNIWFLTLRAIILAFPPWVATPVVILEWRTAALFHVKIRYFSQQDAETYQTSAKVKWLSRSYSERLDM